MLCVILMLYYVVFSNRLLWYNKCFAKWSTSFISMLKPLSQILHCSLSFDNIKYLDSHKSLNFFCIASLISGCSFIRCCFTLYPFRRNLSQILHFEVHLSSSMKYRHIIPCLRYEIFDEHEISVLSLSLS